MSFKQFSFDNALCAALESAGYRSASALNEALIPQYLNACDLYVTAPLGAGKTTSALICAFHQTMQLKTDTNTEDNAPSVIILVPTREQGNHVVRTAIEISRFIPNAPRISTCQNPYHLIENPPPFYMDILVTTPENFVDSIKEKNISAHRVQTVIYKCADQMIDAGYWNEMERIHRLMPKDYQSVILASNSLEGDLAEISRVFQKSPFKYTAQAHDDTNCFINERVQIADHLDHKKQLLDFLVRDGEVTCAYIITCTSVSAKKLSLYLQSKLLPNTLVLDKGKTDVDANVADEERKYLPKIVIGTDTSIRKLGDQSASHIINFQFPRSPEIYFSRQRYLSDKTKNPAVISLVNACESKRLTFLEGIINKPLLQGLIPGLEPELAKNKHKNNRQGRPQKRHDRKQKSAQNSEYSGFMRSNTRRTQPQENEESLTKNTKPAPLDAKLKKKKQKNQYGAKNQGNSASKPYREPLSSNDSQPSYHANYGEKLYQNDSTAAQEKTQANIKIQRKFIIPDEDIPSKKGTSTISRIAGKLGLSTKKQ